VGLKTFTQNLTVRMEHDNAYVSVDDVEHNTTAIGCPAEHRVTTTPWRDPAKLINSNLHASEITFTSGATQEKSKTYISAQSPIPKKDDADGFFACEKFLAKAIESKSGLFQFVSPSKTGGDSYISKRSIVGQLTKKWVDSEGDLTIGDRYKVMNFDPLDTASDDEDWDKKSNSHFVLKVEDTQGKSTPISSIAIVLTQARAEFKNKLLSTTGIKEVSALMDEHNYRAAPTSRKRPDPIVISHAGIGRNATLIVYREILGRIQSDGIADIAQLEKEVITSIEQGRTARGPQFVHSDEQVCELVKALQEELKTKKSVDKPPVDQQPKPQPRREANTGLAEEVEGEGAIISSTEIHQQSSEVSVQSTDLVTAAQIERDRLLTKKMQQRNVDNDASIKRSAAGKAFKASRFVLRDNAGGGNCLFHAIAGTKNTPDLSDSEMDALRNKVAHVLEEKPDDPDNPDINYFDYCLTMLSGETPPADNHGRPVFENSEGMETHHVSNAMMAQVQRMPGHIAGDREIAQWLALPENQNKTVVVVEALAGCESIITFQYGKREAWDLKKQIPPLSEDAAVERLRASLATALAEEARGVAPSDRTQLALYRTLGHWQAITGVNKNSAAARSEQEHLADIKRQIELARTVDISKL
jgi:hypothetical protein